MADKLTVEQFGQRIKAKHPEYADIPDAELGNKVLAKHPEYGDMIDQRGGAAKAFDWAMSPLVKQGPAEKNAMEFTTGAPTEFDIAHPYAGASLRAVSGMGADTLQTLRGFTSPAAIATLGLGAIARGGMAGATLARTLLGGAGLGFGIMGGKQLNDATSPENTAPLPDRVQQGLQGTSAMLIAPGMVKAGAGGLARGVNKAATSKAGVPPPGEKFSPSELQTFADQNGIPATPAQVTGSKFMRRVQDVGRGSLLAGKFLEDRINAAADGVRQKYVNLLGTGASDTIDSLTSGMGNPSTPEAAGASVQNAVEQAATKARGDVRAAYGDVDKLSNGVPVDFPATRSWARSALAQLTDRAKNAPELLDSGTMSLLKRASRFGLPEEVAPAAPKLSSVLDEYGRPIQLPADVPAPHQPLGFSGAQDLRSGFLRASAVDGTPLPTESKALLRNVAAAIDQDMQSAAADNPALMPAFRKAAGLSKELHSVFDDPAHPLSRIYNATDPSSVMGTVRGGGNGGSTFLASALQKYGAVTPQLKQAFVRSLGDPNGTGAFNEKTFLNNMGRYSDSFLSKMLSPDELSQMQQAGKQAVIRAVFDRSQGEGDMSLKGSYGRLTQTYGKTASRFFSPGELSELQKLAKLSDNVMSDSNPSGTAHVGQMGVEGAALLSSPLHPTALAVPASTAAASLLSLSPLLSPGYQAPAPPSFPTSLSFLLAPNATKTQQ